MSSAKIVIFETGEVFDTRKDLAVELGVSKSTVGNYLDKNNLYYDLHIYSIPDKDRKCIHCGVNLTEKNWYKFCRKDTRRICKKCCNKQNIENNKRQRVKNWFGYKYRVLRGAYGGDVTKEELKQLFEVQNKCCALCESKLELNAHLDHIIPLSRGGKTKIENLQFLCEMCNRGKFNWTTKKYIKHCKKVAKNNPASLLLTKETENEMS